MNCQQCRVLLSAVVDGEATETEVVAAERHLARCPACRSVREGMFAVTRRLRVRAAEPCPELTDAILAACPSLPSATGETLGAQDFSAEAAAEAQAQPGCVPDGAGLWLVGRSGCGCAAKCGCGCQDGASCGCRVAA